MFKRNKRNSFIIIILTILISIIVIISLNLILLKIYNQKKQKNFNLYLTHFESYPIITSKKYTAAKSVYKNYNWRIQISKINLDAPILEGTEKEILRRGVGHFRSSSKWDGNVCLAAHNRGYKYNYFAEIKKLEIGDIVKYITDKRNT